MGQLDAGSAGGLAQVARVQVGGAVVAAHLALRRRAAHLGAARVLRRAQRPVHLGHALVTGQGIAA